MFCHHTLNKTLPGSTTGRIDFKYLNKETKEPRDRQRATWKLMMED